MIRSLPQILLSVCFFVAPFVITQSSTTSGYVGYSLDMTGDDDSAVYDTASTPANVSTTVPPPDVYLNATVHVSEIDINVENLTAKINVDAQVLSLLTFNAGVDLSIDSVELLIQNVNAHAILEARLANVVTMIDDVLDSLDLNPVIATLAQDLGTLVSSTASSVSPTASSVARRSYQLENNILFSVNDYGGNRHTNRVLKQDGSIVDEFLDNNGTIYNEKCVGTYAEDMTFTGYNQSAVRDGSLVRELEYVYAPFHGLPIVSAIYTDETGTVVATQVLSEGGAGGSSTVGGS